MSKKKILKILLIVGICVLVAAAVVGTAVGVTTCKKNKGNESEQTREYTVTYDLDGGMWNNAYSVKVKDGEKLAKPSDPAKDGYVFGGWTYNGSAYDFNTAVTGDITLKAVWNKGSYTVTFDLDGGTWGNNALNIEVSAGSKFSVVIQGCGVPAKTNYTFDGWVDANGNVFDGSTEITANITVKAKWEASHVHTWSAWQTNETQHWKVPVCEGKPTPECLTDKSELGTHVDTNSDGVCKTCGYVGVGLANYKSKAKDAVNATHASLGTAWTAESTADALDAAKAKALAALDAAENNGTLSDATEAYYAEIVTALKTEYIARLEEAYKAENYTINQTSYNNAMDTAKDAINAVEAYDGFEEVYTAQCELLDEVKNDDAYKVTVNIKDADGAVLATVSVFIDEAVTAQTLTAALEAANKLGEGYSVTYWANAGFNEGITLPEANTYTEATTLDVYADIEELQYAGTYTYTVKSGSVQAVASTDAKGDLDAILDTSKVGTPNESGNFKLADDADEIQATVYLRKGQTIDISITGRSGSSYGDANLDITTAATTVTASGDTRIELVSSDDTYTVTFTASASGFVTFTFKRDPVNARTPKIIKIELEIADPSIVGET